MESPKDLLFQSRAKDTHDRLLKQNSSLFSVSEIKHLVEMPSRTHGYAVPWYTENDVRYLEKLGQRIFKDKTSVDRDETK